MFFSPERAVHTKTKQMGTTSARQVIVGRCHHWREALPVMGFLDAQVSFPHTMPCVWTLPLTTVTSVSWQDLFFLSFRRSALVVGCCIAGSYYVTWGARADLQTAPGAPLPPFGKCLGKLNSDDLKTVIQKGLVQYSREHRELDILIFKEVTC